MGMNQQECWYFGSKARLWVLETKMGVSTAKDIHSNRNITIAPLLDGNSPLDHPETHSTMVEGRGKSADATGDACEDSIWLSWRQVSRIWENEASNLTSGRPNRHWNRKRMCLPWNNGALQECTLHLGTPVASKTEQSVDSSASAQQVSCLIFIVFINDSLRLWHLSESKADWDWHFLSKHRRYEYIYIYP